MLILEGRLTWVPSPGPAGPMGDVCTEADVCVCVLRGGGAGEAAVYFSPPTSAGGKESMEEED